jgi:calcineurin-like phosphoesterase family protein
MNVKEMNDTLIANHNDYVMEDDICIWVGDIGFGNDAQINELLDQCTGYKILIVGNHEFNGKMLRKLNFDEIHLIYQIDTPNTSLVFTHYPMNNIKLPWFNIHGHLHVHPTLDTGNVLHYNVNCEAHNYRPIELEHVISIAKMRTIAAGI